MVRPSRASGQATVEFVLVLPMVLLVLLALLQFGLYMVEQLQISGAAREGAREATVRSDRRAIEDAARRAAPELDMSIDVERPGQRGAPAVVQVSAPATRLPLVGSIVARHELRATATMRVEKAS